MSDMTETADCAVPADDDLDQYKVLPKYVPGVTHKADKDVQACIDRQKRELNASYTSDVRDLLKNKLHVQEIQIHMVDNGVDQIPSKGIPYGLDATSNPGKLILNIQFITNLNPLQHCNDLSSKYLSEQFGNWLMVANIAEASRTLDQAPAGSGENSAQNGACEKRSVLDSDGSSEEDVMRKYHAAGFGAPTSDRPEAPIQTSGSAEVLVKHD